MEGLDVSEGNLEQQRRPVAPRRSHSEVPVGSGVEELGLEAGRGEKRPRTSAGIGGLPSFWGTGDGEKAVLESESEDEEDDEDDDEDEEDGVGGEDEDEEEDMEDRLEIFGHR